MSQLPVVQTPAGLVALPPLFFVLLEVAAI
jgi:hypothetical protein